MESKQLVFEECGKDVTNILRVLVDDKSQTIDDPEKYLQLLLKKFII